MTSDAAAVLRAFADLVWNRGDFTAGEALFAPGFQHHDLVTGREADLGGYFASISHQRNAFPGVRFEIEDMVVDGAQVATRWSVAGIHAESGRSVKVAGMSFDRLSGGRIAENWTVWDRFGLLQQLAPDQRRSADSTPT